MELPELWAFYLNFASVNRIVEEAFHWNILPTPCLFWSRLLPIQCSTSEESNILLKNRIELIQFSTLIPALTVNFKLLWLMVIIPRQGPKAVGNLQPPHPKILSNFGFYCIFNKEFFRLQFAAILPLVWPPPLADLWWLYNYHK